MPAINPYVGTKNKAPGSAGTVKYPVSSRNPTARRAKRELRDKLSGGGGGGGASSSTPQTASSTQSVQQAPASTPAPTTKPTVTPVKEEENMSRLEGEEAFTPAPDSQFQSNLEGDDAQTPAPKKDLVAKRGRRGRIITETQAIEQELGFKIGVVEGVKGAFKPEERKKRLQNVVDVYKAILPGGGGVDVPKEGPTGAPGERVGQFIIEKTEEKANNPFWAALEITGAKLLPIKQSGGTFAERYCFWRISKN
jgi:hypothetical protein